jgi:hypothetical protein
LKDTFIEFKTYWESIHRDLTIFIDKFGYFFDKYLRILHDSNITNRDYLIFRSLENTTAIPVLIFYFDNPRFYLLLQKVNAMVLRRKLAN